MESPTKKSLFDSAVRKFGHDKAFGLLDEWGGQALSGVPLFMLAASNGVDGTGGAPLDVIYHLMKRNVHGLFSSELFQECTVPV